MGALTYYPERELEERAHSLNLDELAVQCQKILNTEYSDKLDELYRLGGTSEKCVEIMEMIESTVKEMLGRYLQVD